MGHRVIGLTRTGSKVRAAVVETRLRRFELKTVLEIELRQDSGQETNPEDDDRPSEKFESVADALNRVLVPALNTSDSLVTLYPGDSGFIRRLSFPFRDKARIAEVLPMELGSTLPTGLDVDLHTNFERAGGDGNDIIAVGVQKEPFRSWIESWRLDGIEPAHIGMESLELAAWLPYLKHDEDSNVMLVWVEGGCVEFMVARKTSVRLCRAVRLDRGVLDGGEINAVFMREVMLCVAAASEDGAPLDTTYVCGDGAADIASTLSELLSIECRVLDPRAIGVPGAENCEGLDTRMARVAAMAIGVADGAGPASLNLRQGEFGLDGAAGLVREKAGFFMVAAIIFALLGIGWSTVRYVGLVNDRNALEKQLVEVSSGILDREVSDFNAALREVRTGAREELVLFPKWTAVGTLEKITRSVLAAGPAGNRAAAADDTGEPQMEEEIPEDPGYAMELENIRVEPKMATMKGEAESIEKVDELMNRLRAEACFHEIITESTERIQFKRHQGWQRFTVRMNIDCAQKETKKGAAESDSRNAGSDE